MTHSDALVLSSIIGGVAMFAGLIVHAEAVPKNKKFGWALIIFSIIMAFPLVITVWLKAVMG